jgi:hypothetical protein
LPPGTYAIEIRNTTFPSYSKTLTLKAGEKVRVEHKF